MRGVQLQITQSLIQIAWDGCEGVARLEINTRRQLNAANK